jgi:hypothetical protein
MNTAEFSAELDIIYENINKNGAPGLDEYEKSVILTHAQETLVKEILRVEPAADRFPELIKTATAAPSGNTGFGGILFPAPTGILKILNEKCTDGTEEFTALVISNEQLQTKHSKPYKYPPRRRVWRIGASDATALPEIEVYARPNVVLTGFTTRYVAKPQPIILTDLGALTPPESIDGVTAITECALDEGLHRDILRLAAGLAEQYYMDKYTTKE